MPKYQVDLKEVWIQTVEVEAESEEAAVALVKCGEGEYLNMEYSDTLDLPLSARLVDDDQEAE